VHVRAARDQRFVHGAVYGVVMPPRLQCARQSPGRVQQRARRMKSTSAVEIKGSTLPVLRVVVRDAAADALVHELAATLARARPLLAESIAVLDLRACSVAPDVAFVSAVHGAGVRFAGALVADGADPEAYAELGLPLIEAPEPPAPRERARPATAPEPAAPAGEAAAPAPDASPAPDAAAAQPAAPLVLTRPLRSGQRVYARGRDLVVLAPTSRGAELIADGSIYAFARLRGRVLAGAGGAADARIVATELDAELVAVAGVYRTLESADTAPLAGRAAQVTLARDADGGEHLAVGALEGVVSIPT
jgi:septum site-determining protein MinC